MASPEEAWVICRARRSDLVYLRNTLDAYEGLCMATTLPGRDGRLRLLTTVSQVPELRSVLDDLAQECHFEVEHWGKGAP